MFFNIFIYDLMNELNCSKHGIRLGDSIYNCFAYADAISWYNSIVPRLQALMVMCVVCANKWRFNFVIKKSQCLSVGYKPDCFVTEPIWH